MRARKPARVWRLRSGTVASLIAVVTLAAGATSPLPARASTAASSPRAEVLFRAREIGARLDVRYRPGLRLAVTEASSTGVLESYSLLTPNLQGTRVVSARNGVYYAICPVHARCPYPTARDARRVEDVAPRRLALELAVRTFLETAADLVVVSLPTPDYVAFVVEREELSREVDLQRLANALGGNPSRALPASLVGLVDRVTRPRVFVALGLEPTPSGRTSWVGIPRWPAAAGGGERLPLATPARSPIRFELALAGVAQLARPGNVADAGGFAGGAFRSQSPFCDAGQVVELRRGVSGRWLTADRRFTCADGSGSVDAHIWLMGMDESAGGEDGVWRIVAGSGAYATLRGIGAYTSAVVEGGKGPTTHEAWAGDAAFDVVSPRVAILAVSLARPSARNGSHVVRVAFTARDGPHRAVDFIVTARNRFLLAAKTGRTVWGAAVALRLSPGTGGRKIRLKVEATDWVGNTRKATATVVLPD